MDWLFDLFSSSWWILFIIVLVVRAVNATKAEANKKRSSGNTQKSVSKVQEYLEKMRAEMDQRGSMSSFPGHTETESVYDADDDYDDDDDDDEVMSPFLKHPPAQPVFPVQKSSQSIADPFVNDLSGSKEITQPVKVEQKGSAFPQNLDYLSPLKRAMVLSEILGPPKGQG